MSERGAVEALKASFRGVVAASTVLGPLEERVLALTDGQEVSQALLADLARVSGAVALAAAALRGVSESLARHEAGATSSASADHDGAAGHSG